MKKQILCGAIAFALAWAASDVMAEWAHWRGPLMNGVSTEKNLPATWSPDGENLLWKNKVGGMSTPIVMNDRIYVMGRANEVPFGGEPGKPETLIVGPKTQETVVCIDANTGKTLWQHAENVTQSDAPFHRLGWSSVTGDPATGRVYAMFVMCQFVCLDGATGKAIWSRQLTEDQGFISTFGGRTPSPVVDGDQVFIGGVSFGWGDQARGQHRIFAFDKATGKLNWSSATGGPPVDTSMTTPVPATVNGQRLIITVAGDGGVHAFKANTGEKVWSFQASKRGLNTTPIVDGTRLYVAHSEENLDSPVMGRLVALDISGKTPKELWRIEGLEAGFASGTLVDGRIYWPDNKGTIHCVDAATGKRFWQRSTGTIGRPSLVYGDGKLYAGEANGRFYIYELQGEQRPKQLSKVELGDKLGREYAMFGGAAISNGRVVIMTATNMFCFGTNQPAATPAPTKVETAPPGPPAFVSVTPNDVTLRPGEQVKFNVGIYDANGTAITQFEKSPGTNWSLGQLTIGAAPSVQTATRPASAPAPVKIGNLAGTLAPDGTFTAGGNETQVGAVVASFGNLTGSARVRVLPALPWSIDFEKYTEDKPPLTFVGAGGKFATRTIDANGQKNKVLVKTTDNDLYARARTNFGHSGMSNYTLQADVYTGSQMISNQRQMPDIGIINSKYVLVLMGNHQRAQLHVWSTELPDERKASGSINKTIDYAWDPNTWYTLKIRVEQQAGKAIIKGKVWPKGKDEPADYQLTLEDTQPNISGSPGFYGNSLVGAAKSEIFYDNVIVTENK